MSLSYPTYPYPPFCWLHPSHSPPHFPTTHTFPTSHSRSEINYQVPYWLDKGIIIFHCGKMCLSVVWAQTRMGKLALLFSFPSPTCKECSLPATPTSKSFLPPHKTCVLAGERGSPLLRSSVPSCYQCFSLSLERLLGEEVPFLGLKPKAHLYGCACHKQHAKQACPETRISDTPKPRKHSVVQEKPLFLFLCFFFLFLYLF